MVSQIISSLAILKVNWDTLQKDYVENFVPFIAQCVLLLKPSVVSVSELQQKCGIIRGIERRQEEQIKSPSLPQPTHHCGNRRLSAIPLSLAT